MASVKNQFDWPGFTPEILTSLYKYGAKTPPLDYLKTLRPDGSNVEVYLDAKSYVAGPGRYALANEAPFVRDLMTGKFETKSRRLAAKRCCNLDKRES